jgi:hypothetical protein
MRRRAHLYPVVIEQGLDVDRLSGLSEAAVDDAAESGYLAGIFGAGDLDPLRFAETTLTLCEPHRGRSPSVDKRFFDRGLAASISTCDAMMQGR